MHTYSQIHKHTFTYAQLQILFTHTRTHTRNKYILIPVHSYRDIQIHSFIHEHIKKIFDQNILNRKIISNKNIFTVKKLF